MQTNIYQLYNRKLNGLTVFRALLEDVLIQRLQKLLRACEESDAETLTCTYGAFTSALFEKNVNFSEALLELVLADENRFLLSAARGLSARHLRCRKARIGFLYGAGRAFRKGNKDNSA